MPQCTSVRARIDAAPPAIRSASPRSADRGSRDGVARHADGIAVETVEDAPPGGGKMRVGVGASGQNTMVEAVARFGSQGEGAIDGVYTEYVCAALHEHHSLPHSRFACPRV